MSLDGPFCGFWVKRPLHHMHSTIICFIHKCPIEFCQTHHRQRKTWKRNKHVDFSFSSVTMKEINHIMRKIFKCFQIPAFITLLWLTPDSLLVNEASSLSQSKFCYFTLANAGWSYWSRGDILDWKELNNIPHHFRGIYICYAQEMNNFLVSHPQ